MNIYSFVSWTKLRSDSCDFTMTFLCSHTHPTTTPCKVFLSSLLWHHEAAATLGATVDMEAHILFMCATHYPQVWSIESGERILTLVSHHKGFSSFQGMFEPETLALANEFKGRVMESTPRLLWDKQHGDF